jgi:hypothetical protein
LNSGDLADANPHNREKPRLASRAGSREGEPVDAVPSTAEGRRIEDARLRGIPWAKWGPYLSERQWGTVREDYGVTGEAWTCFTHDMARSRAYRWGEDGIAGFSDEKQRLCLSPVLCYGRDPILKERPFGLANSEGNRGEDVKECYYYLDATPTDSYLKMVYGYPQREYPYALLVEANRRRGKEEPESELADTGVLLEDRYFDVFVEYAKAGPEDVVMRVRAVNRGPVAAPLHVLAQVFFRNTWSWGNGRPKPYISLSEGGDVVARGTGVGEYHVHADGEAEWLFTENETNVRRLFGRTGEANHYKDAFNDFVTLGDRSAVNPARTGTKVATNYQFSVPAGGEAVMRLRLAQEVAPCGVRVNGIAPGAIRTPIDVEAWNTPEAYASLMELVPCGRIGETDDVARAAVWLASDDSNYVNGTTLFVDGGMTLYPGFTGGG